MEFYKAKLLQIKLLSRPSRFMYWRLANASQVFFLWFDISWRRSWLPQAAYQHGWDAAFRQFHGIDESGITQRAADGRESAQPAHPEVSYNGAKEQKP